MLSANGAGAVLCRLQGAGFEVGMWPEMIAMLFDYEIPDAL